ncbi:MAG: Ig-like domain-containing protein [Candidatus Thorarchaeota archaeon]
MKVRRHILVPILLILAVLLISNIGVSEVKAGPIIDPGGGDDDSGSSDNVITNARFEDGTVNWNKKSGFAGSLTISTSTVYEGTKSLKIQDAIAVGGFVWSTAYQSVYSSIDSNTYFGAAIYLDSDATHRLAAVMLHIAPADYYLVYWVSDNWKMVDNEGVQYTWKLSGNQDKWVHFYSNVYSDISSKGKDPTGQHIDEVWCQVRTESWWWQSCDAYFDQLYLGSTPPSLTISSPADNTWVHDTVTFSGTAADNRGEGYSYTRYLLDPNNVMLLFPNLFWQSVSGTTTWSLSIDTTDLTDGDHRIYFYARDRTGSTTRKSIAFRVDNTDPTLSINNPSASSWHSGSITVSGTAADGMSGIAKVKCKIGSTDWVMADGTTSWSCTLDSTLVDDGFHTISVVAYDNAGNIDLKTVSVHIDNTAPTLGTPTLTPTYGPEGTTFTVSVPITEKGAGVYSATAIIIDPNGVGFEVPLNASISSSSSPITFTGVFSPSGAAAQGTYTLKSISVSDKVSNSASRDYSGVWCIFDTTLPTITVDSHASDDVVTGQTIHLFGSASDGPSGVNSLQLKIDGEAPVNLQVSNGAWDFYWDTSDYVDGYHVFQFRCVDNAGNTRIVYRYIVLRNQGESTLPYVPAIDQTGAYIGYSRVTSGDIQLVILYNVGPAPLDSTISLLIPSPMIDSWRFADLSYVKGDDTYSIGSLSSIVWSPENHRLSFPVRFSDQLDVRDKSVIVSLLKEELIWSLNPASNKTIEEGTPHTLSFTVRNSNGDLPQALPFDVALQVVQNGKAITIAQAQVDTAGDVTFTFTLDTSFDITAGGFATRIIVVDDLDVLQDVSTTISEQFSGFTYWRIVSWEFTPDDLDIIHYSAVPYDQRPFTVSIVLRDSAGNAAAMIGQRIDVTILGPSTNETKIIYQTEHGGCISAEFVFSPTEVGDYTISFDFVSNGYYVDMSSHVLQLHLQDQRPVSVEFESPEITVGNDILLSCNLTDNWAGDYPVAGINVTFSYELNGVRRTIGSAVTDGFGAARIYWSLTESEWVAFAGSELRVYATSVATPTYSGNEAMELVVMGTVGTFFQQPLVGVSSINAGDNATITILLSNQFGTLIERQVTLLLEGPYDYSQEFEITCGPSSTFEVTLPVYGTYTITATYSGDAIYNPTTATDEIVVNGYSTAVSINPRSNLDAFYVGEPISVSFDLFDYYSNKVENGVMQITVDYGTFSDSFVVIEGQNDTIQIIGVKTGAIDVDCTYAGDLTYEPSRGGITLTIQGRPVSVLLEDIPSVVHPYVSPSNIEYTLEALVLDSINGSPLYNDTVLFCYVTESELAIYPTINQTDYLNTSAVYEYLAWGVFHEIGAVTTDANGLASMQWQVETISEQSIVVFAITLHDSVLSTGVSSPKHTVIDFIDTEVSVNSEWSGEETDVRIDVFLYDEFGNRLFDQTVQVNITGPIGMMDYATTFNIVTGFNDSITVNLPEYGLYELTAKYYGDVTYDPSTLFTDTFTVSWRMLSIALAGPTSIVAGDPIDFELSVTDLNGTAGSPLQEDILVHLAYFTSTGITEIGSVSVDDYGLAQMSWTPDSQSDGYSFVAFTTRTMIYDAAMSEILHTTIVPLDTNLTLQVERYYKCPFNLTYSFKVFLEDSLGNSLDGENVNLIITTNYTEFWSGTRFGSDNQPFIEGQHCFMNYQVFRFTVIIGVNDTFSWQVPGRFVDIISVGTRAIAIAEYVGTPRYFPSIDMTKLSCCLIETDTDIWIEGNPETLMAGVPVTIHANVTDEYGYTLEHGKVNLTIYTPSGVVDTIQIDLMFNSTAIWTPPSTGRYTIRAEFLGGEQPRYLRHRARCGGGFSHYHWRLSYIYNMRLTRSYDILNIQARHVDVGITFDELPLNTHIGTIILLRGHVFNIETGLPISGYPVSFFYMDERGTFQLIGMNITDSTGTAFFTWDLSGLARPEGYYTYHVYASGQNAASGFLKKYSDHPVKIWPESSTPASPLGTSPGTPKIDDPVSNAHTNELLGIALVSFIVFISLSTLNRVRPDVFRRFMVLLMLLSTIGLLYVGLAIESFSHPFAMNLVSNVSVGFDGMKDAPATAPSQNTSAALARPTEYSRAGTSANTNLWSGGSFYFTADDPTTETQSIVTTTPNASYVVIPLQKSLHVNFTATGRYIVSVVDKNRNPVDTVAGAASGPVNVSFLITPDKYEPGSKYSVNIFVIVERLGIIYADTSWVVMLVSRTATYINLLLQNKEMSYNAMTLEVPIAARLTQMHSNISIADVELEFYYRSAYDLIWHSIGSSFTNENGLASLIWTPSLAKGDYVINVTFTGTKLLDGAMSADVFSVTGAETILTYAPGSPTSISVQYAHPFEIASQLKSYQNIPLSNRTIHYYFVEDNIEYWIGSSLTDTDGIARFEYVPYMESGSYDLAVKFEGDDNYAPSHQDISDGLTVLKRFAVFEGNLTLTAANGEEVTISMPLSDDMGNAITERTALLQVYQPSTGHWLTLAVTKTDMAGHARFDYVVDLEPGVHSIRVAMKGDKITQGSAIQGTIKVTPHITNIFCVPVDAHYGETVTVSANLADADGVPIQDATILFYLEDGSVWSLIGYATTDSDGWADLDWTVTSPTGEYRIKAIYPGSDYYASSGCIVSGVQIQQVASTLLVSTCDVAHVTQPTLFNATLLDGNGVPLSARPITYHIESDTGFSWSCVLQTDADGFTSLEFVPPYLGWFTITVSFEGDSYYLPSSYTNNFEAIKIGAVVTLSVSQTSAHRGDTLYFSGQVTFYDSATKQYRPVESGVPFKLILLSDSSASIGSDVQIVTGENGAIEGYWTIPLKTSQEITNLFLAQEYSFRIEIVNSVYSGSADFDLDIVLRTKLTLTPVFPTVNGVKLDTVYVDMPMDYEFILVDEDNKPLTGVATKTRFNDNDWLYYTTDSNGAWAYRNSIMDSAGAIRVLGKFVGSRFLDSAQDEVQFTAVRRPLEISLALGSYYLHRGDTCSVRIKATDTVWGSPLIGASIPVKILLDGKYAKTAYLSSGSCDTEIIMPARLQTGEHTVDVIVDQSRVYLTGTDTNLFDAYEYSTLEIHTTNSAKTGDNIETRLTLYDEDGSPLSDRFVSFDVQYPDGSFKAFILKTDSIGRAATLWEPKDVGSYSLNAEFDGEYQFVGDAAAPHEVQVESGDAQNEVGPSPLWLLPIILAVLADVVIEATTFGVLAYIDVTAKIGDGYLHISKYSYPWVEIHYVEVSLPWGGTITVPVPVIVVRSGFSFDMTQGDQVVSFSDGDDEGQSSNYNGGDLFDGLLGKLDTIEEGMANGSNPPSVSPEQAPSHLCLPAVAPDDTPHTEDKLGVEIVSPTNRARVQGHTNVTAVVTGVVPSQIERVVVLVGDEEIGNMSYIHDNVYYYDWDTTEKKSGLPKFGNGYDWLEVKVELNNGTETTDKNVVNIFNWGTFFIGFGLMCAAEAFVFLISLVIIKVAKVVFSGAEANTFLRILRDMIVAVITMLLTFGLMMLLFEIISSFGVAGWWGGLFFGLLTIVAGVLLLFLRGSTYKTNAKLIPRIIIGVTAGVTLIGGGILGDIFGDGWDGWASPAIDVISGVTLSLVSAGVMRAAYHGRPVHTKFKESIEMQAVGIGFISAGILIITKTIMNAFLLFNKK